jgi:hypothetical protein
MVSRKVLVLTTGLLVLAVVALPAARAQKGAPPAPPAAAEYTFSGPFTHANLTLFLVHGKDTLPGKSFLTLQEALEQKKIVVHETENVNELSVENVSPEIEVFIQTGDIVKGGKQDRLIAFDLIVPAKSGRLPIASFCVEQGRWRPRGSEAPTSFGVSSQQAAGKDLKIAVNKNRDQRRVWREVAENQRKLSDNLMKPVQATESPTSLQLAQEDKDLLKTTDEYLKALGSALAGKNDVIGYVYAINGKVESGDIYGSTALFQKLWPRLLRSSAIEAFAELKKDKKFEPTSLDAVKTFLADAAAGKKAEEKDVSRRVGVCTCESDKNLLIEARDKQAGAVLHRTYLAK